jgi:hypothetical protein
MFRAILFTQWKWTRMPLALGMIAAFGLPLLSVQGTGWPGLTRYDAAWVLGAVMQWSPWYPALAAGLGLLLASTAWSADHRGRHVYALSLPVERWRFALLRFVAGGTLLAAPLVLFLAGATVAGAATHLPPGLHAYPLALTVRFALAALLAYAIFSAISAGTARFAGYVLLLVGLVVGLHLVLAMADVHGNVFGSLFDRLTVWPGPFEVFTGRWMLIDV